MAGTGREGEGRSSCRVIAQGYRVVDEERHAVDYRPSVWGDYFIKNPTLPHPHEVCVRIYMSTYIHISSLVGTFSINS
jgi:hypothetical protein